LAEADYNLGIGLFAKGDLDGAIAEYRQAIHLKPDDPDAHNNLGRALGVKGDLDGAIAEYRQALRSKPDYAEAHYNLGTTLLSKGDEDGAIAEYRQALHLKPDMFEAHYYLGNALQDKGDRDGAIAAYQRALALNPKFPEALANLGSALASKGEIGEAIDAYRKALKLMPDSGQIHLGLGVALRRNGDEAAANREFQQAQRLDPKLNPPPPRGTLPIADNFPGGCGWPSGEIESFSYGCEQGAYRMRLKKPGPVHVMQNFSLEVRAVSAEVDVGVDSGTGTDPGRALLGLGCLTDENHGYMVMLKTNGTGGIVRFSRDFTPLAGQNKAGGIQELGRTNRLRVVCDGRGEKVTRISFYVNGRKVASAEDEQGYRWFNGFVLYADTFPGVVTFGHFFAGRPTD
jgi:tetratricopeptide (TPR) repeat protein